MTKLADVNTTDIREAIRLGCQTMSCTFNADDNDIPFFLTWAYPDPHFAWEQWCTEAHVPGRHLNALLNAEDAAGIAIDEEAIDKHARATFYSYSGAIPIPLNRDRLGGTLTHLHDHHLREGFHALYALAKYRHSERAMEMAAASIKAINTWWNPAKGWDWDYIRGTLGIKTVSVPDEFITGPARAIGPLAKLYRATGYAPALDLAVKLKERVLWHCFPTDGHYELPFYSPHVHSTTSVLSSLAQLADLLHDGDLMQRVKAFCDNGLWALRDQTGWVITGDEERPEIADVGEVNCTGDVLETALILGRWGYTAYYEDAERILRGHLLPAQLRDVSWIREPANPNHEDARRDVARRHQGAYGFAAPYGHWPVGAQEIAFNLDVVGGSVGSLCEAYREVVRTDSAGTWVNLLFDHETSRVQVESPYTHAALRVRAKTPGALFVRIPSWVEADRLRVDGVEEPESRFGNRRSASGTEQPWRMTNGYAMIAQPPVNRWLTFSFPLAEREIVLKHRTRDIRARLRGDAIVAMDNWGMDLTFFDPIM